jgi:hypothetical protein
MTEIKSNRQVHVKDNPNLISFTNRFSLLGLIHLLAIIPQQGTLPKCKKISPTINFSLERKLNSSFSSTYCFAWIVWHLTQGNLSKFCDTELNYHLIPDHWSQLSTTHLERIISTKCITPSNTCSGMDVFSFSKI